MTGFNSKRQMAQDRLDDDDIQIYAQPKQEPVAHKQEFVSPGGGYVPAIPAQQPTQQEPVAYMSHNKENFVSADDVGNSVPNWTDYYPTPLYTTPPPCPTCEALARTVMMDQIGRDA